MQTTTVALRALACLALATFLSAGAVPCMAQARLPPDVTSAIRKAYGDGEMHYLDRSVDLNGELGAVPATVAYRCQGIEARPVTAVFYAKTEPPAAVLTVGDRRVVAFIAPSGSGAKYTAPGVEVWEHHGEASIEWFGKRSTCKAL
jgi:uncharacterized protein